MSKWQNLLSPKLTPSEKQYFTEKSQDGLRETEHGHLCFCGSSESKVMCTYLQKDEKIKKKKKSNFKYFWLFLLFGRSVYGAMRHFLENGSTKLAYYA